MFYTYRQNNSGGSMVIDSKRAIGVTVIVEAESADHANERAEQIGLYFSGVEDGSDCDCCGDRWYPAYDDKGDPVPSDYNGPISDDYEDAYAGPGKPSLYVHYLDGRVHGYPRPAPSEAEIEEAVQSILQAKES